MHAQRTFMKIARATAALILVQLAAVSAWAGASQNELRSGGMERSYRLYVPDRYDGTQAVPLVVSLHGGWGTGEKQAQVSGWDALAEREGFIVAYPDGYRRSWNAGDQCCDPARRKGVQDARFVREMVEHIRQGFRIDPRRIYGNGFSNGGMLAHEIACVDPTLFTALAVNAGALMDSLCAPKQGVPFLIIQGMQDPRMPWNGGTFDGTYRMPVPELAAQIAARNGCSGKSAMISFEQGPATCRSYPGCAGKEVTYCGVEGVGHQWIGGQTVLPSLLGANTDAFRSTDAMWAFYQRHVGRAQK